jgi:hypothetical protein
LVEILDLRQTLLGAHLRPLQPAVRDTQVIPVETGHGVGPQQLVHIGHDVCPTWIQQGECLLEPLQHTPKAVFGEIDGFRLRRGIRLMVAGLSADVPGRNAHDVGDLQMSQLARLDHLHVVRVPTDRGEIHRVVQNGHTTLITHHHPSILDTTHGRRVIGLRRVGRDPQIAGRDTVPAHVLRFLGLGVSRAQRRQQMRFQHPEPTQRARGAQPLDVENVLRLKDLAEDRVLDTAGGHGEQRIHDLATARVSAHAAPPGRHGVDAGRDTPRIPTGDDPHGVAIEDEIEHPRRERRHPGVGRTRLFQ